ncbi:MAG: pilin [Candidatus Moranbacteria bacterium]|nr:pilin [Candidatus Moranbacteria bacterium]
MVTSTWQTFLHKRSATFLLAVMVIASGFVGNTQEAQAAITKAACEALGTGYSCLAASDPAAAGRESVDQCNMNTGFPIVTGNCYKPLPPPSNTGPGTTTGSGSNTGPGTSTGPGSNTSPGTTTGTTTGTTATGTGVTTISFQNPLQYNTVQDVLGSLLTTLQGIIVILCIIFIIIGAILYITSAGDSKRTSAGKLAITAALIGLAIAIAAPSFLKEISNILGWNNTPANVSASLSISAILTNVLNFLLGIVGIIAIIMLVIGAIMYLSAAGDEDRIDTGKSIVKYSIIGIIIAFSALLLVKQVATFFL